MYNVQKRGIRIWVRWARTAEHRARKEVRRKPWDNHQRTIAVAHKCCPLLRNFIFLAPIEIKLDRAGQTMLDKSRFPNVRSRVSKQRFPNNYIQSLRHFEIISPSKDSNFRDEIYLASSKINRYECTGI